MRALKIVLSFLAFLVAAGLFYNIGSDRPHPGLALVAWGFLLLLIWGRQATPRAWYAWMFFSFVVILTRLLVRATLTR